MSEQATIFVVDDDPDIRELLEDYLGDQGYNVVALSSADAFRAAIGKQVPDVVLLDDPIRDLTQHQPIPFLSRWLKYTQTYDSLPLFGWISRSLSYPSRQALWLALWKV